MFAIYINNNPAMTFDTWGEASDEVTYLAFWGYGYEGVSVKRYDNSPLDFQPIREFLAEMREFYGVGS